jgi:hypothetical protein
MRSARVLTIALLPLLLLAVPGPAGAGEIVNTRYKHPSVTQFSDPLLGEFWKSRQRGKSEIHFSGDRSAARKAATEIDIKYLGTLKARVTTTLLGANKLTITTRKPSGTYNDLPVLVPALSNATLYAISKITGQ